MANNQLGTGVLILKANSSQLESGLDKSVGSIKKFEKQSGAAGLSFLKMFSVASLAGMAVKMLKDAARALDEIADKQRKVMELITTESSKREAKKLHLIPESDADAENLQQAQNHAKAWDDLQKEMEARAVGGLVMGINWLSPGLITVPDIKAQEEWMKKQAEAKQRQEELKKSTEDFNAELEKNWVTIGKTAGEIKIWELEQRGVETSTFRLNFRVRLLRNDIAAFEYDLKKSIDTIGMTGDEIKLYEMKLRGASEAQLEMAKQQAALKESLERGIGLVAKDPILELKKDFEALNNLQMQNAITADQYAASLGEVARQFTAAHKAADKQPFASNILAGSAAMQQFLIEAGKAHQSADPMRAFVDSVKEAQRDRDELKALGRELIQVTREKKIEFKVEEINIP